MSVPLKPFNKKAWMCPLCDEPVAQWLTFCPRCEPEKRPKVPKGNNPTGFALLNKEMWDRKKGLILYEGEKKFKRD